MSDSASHDNQIQEIMVLLSQVSEKFEPGENEMKQWIMQNFHSPVINEVLQDSTLMTLRVLDAIGRLEPVNGITISKQSRIPKGSVSKITRRLIAKKLIIRESLPNNKKEILFRTTPLGKEIFLAHQAFDQKMEKGFKRFLKKYTSEELRFIIRVLQDFVKTKFLSV
jgi:DNA-binding MarR family transcriptional regulator